MTQEERYYIFQLNKKDFTQDDIAKEVGVHKSTISRELKRNTGQRGYPPKQAQTKATERRKLASKAIKMTADMIDLIDEKLSEEQWSPEQILGWLLEEKSIAISHEHIYQHIWVDWVYNPRKTSWHLLQQP
ncbi:MAG: helix-turn-helix domain-containing protein [Thiohalomonas sp.]|nr:helix-turn-helix domain-containing protein [Thiohalomonas sp.]